MNVAFISITKKRVAIGLGLFFVGLAARPFIKGIPQSTDAAAAITSGTGTGLVSGSCLIVGAILLACAFVEHFSFPLTRWIEEIYLGNGTSEKPPLDFKLADRHEEKNMYPAAVREYERLLFYYPKSEKTWKRLILLKMEIEGMEAARLTAASAREKLRWNRQACKNIESMFPTSAENHG